MKDDFYPIQQRWTRLQIGKTLSLMLHYNPKILTQMLALGAARLTGAQGEKATMRERV
jgi:hypothetical protein